MDEYTPCKKPDPTAQTAIGNVMRETRHRITGSRRRKALSKDMRTRVYEMYGGHCAYCVGLIVGRLEKLLTFRLALAYGLIQITGRPVKFYFEEREKQC